jgi:branched-chain amino acid transport system ATP-binding protein
MSMQETNPLLEVRDLHVAYGNVRSLQGVSLSVPAGKVVAIVGPNGAGKSTLLRTVSGLKKPRSGTIRFDGGSIVGQRPHRIAASGLLHTPENRDIFGGMTTWENLKVGYDNLGKGVEKAEFERIYSLFPILREKRDQLAGNLSGGQQQMLAIGRSLIASPRLLMLDEPSLGLARLIVRDIFQTIDALRKGGMTILLVEQNARMALQLADYGYVLVNGKIVLEGDRERMLSDDALIDHYLGAH